MRSGRQGGPRRHACCRTSSTSSTSRAEGRGSQAEGPRSRDACRSGKGRMHTCVDQYNANKTANANGGLKWIQKGGGYYSECNKKLKG
jgi:hypothetical protein